MLPDTHERRIINMDPTMVLAQQRMRVGESTNEVDRSGRVVRKDTSATTSSLEIGTNIKEKEKDQESFRQLQELFSNGTECNVVWVTTDDVFKGGWVDQESNMDAVTSV